jgi:hypothetical protein
MAPFTHNPLSPRNFDEAVWAGYSGHTRLFFFAF